MKKPQMLDDVYGEAGPGRILDIRHHVEFNAQVTIAEPKN